MKDKHSSRKRKDSPNPFSGMLTRRKSQIYFHLNRSGQFRSDASFLTPSDHPNAETRASRRRIQSIDLIGTEDDAGGNLSHVSTKDLRARRVFSSPLFVSDTDEKNPELDGSGERIDCEVNPKLKFRGIERVQEDSISNGFGEESKCSRPVGDNEKIVHTTPPDTDILSKQNVLQTEDDCTASPRVANGVKTNSCSSNKKIDFVPRRKLVPNQGNRLKVFKAPSSVSYRRLLPFLLDIAKDKCASDASSCPKIEIVLEEKPTIQSQAPLTNDIHARMSDFKENSSKPILPAASQEMVEECSIDQKFLSNKQAADSTNHISCTPKSKNCSYDNKQPAPVSANARNVVLIPSTPQGNSSHVDRVSSAMRLKVFKTPSSVSYRRLLPYLLDIAKDKSCPLEFNSGPKIEIALEEKPSVQSQVSLTHESCINMSGFEDNTLKPMLLTTSKEMTVDGSKELKIASYMQAAGYTDQISPNSTSTDSPDKTQPTTVSTDDRNALPSLSNSPPGDSSTADLVSSVESEEITTSPALVSDPAVSVTYSTPEVLQCSSDRDHITNVKTYEDAISVCQSTSLVEVLPSAVSPAKAAKGILKRNPSGCRGLCTCLNCASFRLHAERAFEFSRTQFQDTEEIVTDLRKELLHLRSILQMPPGESNSQASLKIDQVKEVCARASKAEEVARNRLEEMKEDLFVHCRIKSLQRPRVNFTIKHSEETSRSGKET